ncbi:crotonase/enoyl-CoA hydratase family protein [Aurantimonas marina]|uniref:crotonase/enoyl-CoA hydratase family protein n=1 Tax=Aurantimonas marina TaxID=2780508 RepID=UPI0019D0F4F3|nr:crotonase/enoyl-CoA hydratase family protein [Aurantimonas marina]
MSDFIETGIESGVLTIRMNRPDKKNAITRDMYRAMADALVAASGDEGVRVVLICGTPGTFTAGNDIKDFIAIAEGGARHIDVHDFLRAIATFSKPLVAAVDGLAIGIGATILMHCDLAYCSPGSIFRTPFLDLGITPEAGSTLIAPKLMGDQRAFALLVLGDTFGAEAAREAGLVYAIVEEGIEATARDAALRLAAKPPKALAIARELLRGQREDLLERIDLEVEYFSERMTSDEAKAAFRAFMAR